MAATGIVGFDGITVGDLLRGLTIDVRGYRVATPPGTDLACSPPSVT
jgi:hypothetical protein